MYGNEFKRILEASENNTLTFFVGAGISALSNVPTWENLTNAICDEIGIEKKASYSNEDYLRIPQIYYYSINKNKNKYYDFIKNKLLSNSAKYNTIHKEMLSLNPNSFITTNFDELIEDAATHFCQSFKVVACDDDVPKINGDRFIIKAHGDFRHKNIVLKEEDYLNYSENFKLIETMIKSIFSTNTVVFIGYGLNDYNIKLVLNWAKCLLKDNFKKPIFVCTRDSSLSKEELKYQESKGISIIETFNLKKESNEYALHYESFFKEIKLRSIYSDKENDPQKGFDILYSLLEPLDKFEALRTYDVASLINRYAIVSENGIIQILKEHQNLFAKYIEINKFSKEERETLPKIELQKFNTISSVFNKALIWKIFDDKNSYNISCTSSNFADDYCLSFDYKYMHSFVQKAYTDLRHNYKKAYYYFRLNKYLEAYKMFDSVAQECFKTKNYLLYYLATSNCISLFNIIKQEPLYYSEDVDNLINDGPTVSNTESLFNNLPAEVKNKYDSIKNLHTVDLLYEYYYSSIRYAQKLQAAIEKQSIEIGFDSCAQVVCKINSYLHFLIGNGIVSEIFSEYKNATKELVSLLMYKYKNQNKQSRFGKDLDKDFSTKVAFDYKDFYCIIENFNMGSINEIFDKYNIKIIEFKDMDKIENNVFNMMSYYEYIIKNPINSAEIMHLQQKIANCFTLLQHVNISQNLLEKICIFIFKFEFHYFYINHKIMFLDHQIYRMKKESNTTTRIIENSLVKYIDRHIADIISNENKFHLASANQYNYYDLVMYLSPLQKFFVSNKLSTRCNKIIEQKLSPLYKFLFSHYYNYVSKKTKDKIVRLANEILIKQFDFEVFKFLAINHCKLNKEIIASLKDYLHKQIEIAVKENQKDTRNIIVPCRNYYDDLVHVGYLCFDGFLEKKDFAEFINYNHHFDFLMLNADFDFNKFDVLWLLKANKYAIEKIYANSCVKDKIQKRILCRLKESNLHDVDANKLKEILINYFC